MCNFVFKQLSDPKINADNKMPYLKMLKYFNTDENIIKLQKITAKTKSKILKKALKIEIEKLKIFKSIPWSEEW